MRAGVFVAVVSCLGAAPARAQGALVDPNPGKLTLTAGLDITNAYLFRGIPQDDTGVIMQPSGDLGIVLHQGDAWLSAVSVNVGLWNSLHTGVAGLDGLGKLWYESDFYAGVTLGIGTHAGVGVIYTAYNSPNNGFATVREVSFKFSLDDSAMLGRAAVRPYALLARELDGQADGGAAEGTYLELGAAPGIGSRLRVSVPVRLGLSVADYYEGANGDERFGFVSVAGVVSAPLSAAPTRFGSWNVHGGVEFVRLGDRNEAILGDRSKVIGSVGVGLSY